MNAAAGMVLNESRAAMGTSEEDYVEKLRKDRVEFVDYYPFFNELNKKILNRQKQLWRAHKEKMLLCCLYYIGKQTVIRAPGGAFGYIPVQINKDDPVYVMNYLRPYSDNVTSLGVKSSPDVLFAILNPDDQQRRKALKIVRNVHAYYNQQHFTEEFKHKTWKYGQLCSTFHSELYYDADAELGYEWMDSYSEHQVPGQAFTECNDCGTREEGAGMGTCPNCGSPNIASEEEEGWQGQAAQPGKYGKAGDLVLLFSSPLGHQYSLTTGAELSPYRYVEEDIPTEILEYQWGRLDAQCTDSQWMDDEMIHPIRILRRAEAQRTSGHGVDDRESTLIQRFFYEPEMLHYVALNKPVTLPNGDVIPAKVRLSEYFPGGKCITTAPGLARFLGVKEESHRKRFIDGKYNINPGQEVGGGIEDALEGNRQSNVLHSMDFTYARRHAMPAVVIDDSVFPNGNLFTRPDGTIRVKRAALDQRSIEQSYSIMRAGERSFTIDPMLQRLQQVMQATTKSLIGSVNAPSGYSQTATGDTLEADKQSTILNVSLGLIGDYTVKISTKRLVLLQETVDKKRLIHVLNPRTGEYEAQAFQAADIKHDFLAWLKPGSAIPVLPEVRQQRLMMATGMVSQLKAIGYDSPAVIRQVNEICQVDFAFERNDEYEDACLEDLQAMTEMVPNVEALLQQGAALATMIPDLQQIDPLAAAAQFLMQVAPVDAAAKGAEVRLNWFSEWLASPQGRKSPEILKAAVRGLLMELKQAVEIQRGVIAEIAAVGAGMIAPPLSQPPTMPGMQPAGKQMPTIGKRPEGGNNGKESQSSRPAPSSGAARSRAGN